MSSHNFYLDAAAQAAANINPHQTKSNPRVGCVVVNDDKIISTGVHEIFGGAHAEVNALSNVPSDRIQQSEVYVTLEPCVEHAHKKTGACTSLLIKLKPKAAIIGALDPHFPGQGVKTLEQAGIKVSVLDSAHHQTLNPWFHHWITTKTPLITLKVAQTLDGKITPPLTQYNLGHRAITGPAVQTQVHQKRALTQAILTSTETVLQDDPLFDVRHVKDLSFEPTPPDVIVIGKRSLPAGAKLYQVKNRQVYHLSEFKHLIPLCQQHSIASILTECGGQLNTALLQANLVQAIQLYTAPSFAGRSAKPSFTKPIDLKTWHLEKTSAPGGDISLFYSLQPAHTLHRLA